MTEENVRENYRRLAQAVGVDEQRFTLTKQIHETEVSVVTEAEAGMGLHQPMAWQSDAIVTALPDTPLIGFYADCVVTLLYDPATHTAGVCHAGWRGMAGGILPKTVDVMAEKLGTRRESLRAVLGPSIRQECFETDADVPEAMEQQLGALVQPYIQEKGVKFHVDLQGIGVQLLLDAGLPAGKRDRQRHLHHVPQRRVLVAPQDQRPARRAGRHDLPVTTERENPFDEKMEKTCARRAARRAVRAEHRLRHDGGG